MGKFAGIAARPPLPGRVVVRLAAARCEAAFKERLENSRVIIVSHTTETLLTYCEVGAVLNDGKLTYYDDIRTAVACYNEIVKAPSDVHAQA